MKKHKIESIIYMITGIALIVVTILRWRGVFQGTLSDVLYFAFLAAIAFFLNLNMHRSYKLKREKEEASKKSQSDRES